MQAALLQTLAHTSRLLRRPGAVEFTHPLKVEGGEHIHALDMIDLCLLNQAHRLQLSIFYCAWWNDTCKLIRVPRTSVFSSLCFLERHLWCRRCWRGRRV